VTVRSGFAISVVDGRACEGLYYMTWLRQKLLCGIVVDLGVTGCIDRGISLLGFWGILACLSLNTISGAITSNLRLASRRGLKNRGLVFFGHNLTSVLRIRRPE